MQNATLWFEELFLSTGIWGLFGPLALVVISYILTKREKPLGIFFIVVDSIVIWQYFQLIGATPEYWWNIFILIFGVIQCTAQILSR